MCCVCCDDIVVVLLLCECVCYRYISVSEKIARNHLNVRSKNIRRGFLGRPFAACCCCNTIVTWTLHAPQFSQQHTATQKPYQKNHFYDFTFYVLSVLTGWQNVLTFFPRTYIRRTTRTAHQYIHKCVKKIFASSISGKLRILYFGSLNVDDLPTNTTHMKHSFYVVLLLLLFQNYIIATCNALLFICYYGLMRCLLLLYNGIAETVVVVCLLVV